MGARARQRHHICMSARAPSAATHPSIPSPADAVHPSQQHTASLSERVQADAVIAVKDAVIVGKKLGPALHLFEQKLLEADMLVFRDHNLMRYLFGVFAGLEMRGLFTQRGGA